MKNYGRTSICEFLGDRIVYRNLVSLDPRLPPLADVRAELGLPQDLVPRKTAPAYAQVIAHLLELARAQDAPGTAIERLIFVGDTRMNDGTAFANLCRAGNWPGLGFIGADRDEPAQVEVAPAVDAGGEQVEGILYLANRWTALAGFEEFCRERQFPLDEATAAVIDLDKTAIGARGRNDHVIDWARIEAVRVTVGDLLGDDFDPDGFQAAYDLLNQPEFHPFTADNQDYLAYVCLILGSGLYPLDSLVADIRAGRMATFEQFIGQVDARNGGLPASLRSIHEEVYALVKQGDPTPMKVFRYNEYATTTGAMGCLEDGATVDGLLADEIVITQEVRELALAWKALGVLLFGLSDKPDEASVPTAELATQGCRPIHRVETHAVGNGQCARCKGEHRIPVHASRSPDHESRVPDPVGSYRDLR